MVEAGCCAADISFRGGPLVYGRWGGWQRAGMLVLAQVGTWQIYRGIFLSTVPPQAPKDLGK